MERIRVQAGRFTDLATLERALPGNYKVVGQWANGDFAVEGEPVAGWSATEYVIPRLASFLMIATLHNYRPSYIFGCVTCEAIGLGGFGPPHFAKIGRAHV